MASEHYHIIDIQWHFTNFHFTNQTLLLLLCFTATLILLPSLFLCIHFCRRRFVLQPSTFVISPLQELSSKNDHYTITMPPSSTTKSLSMVGVGFESKKECSICLSVFQDDEIMKVLTECQHVYHSECLDIWLRVHPSCPLCRASLHVSDSLKKSVISL